MVAFRLTTHLHLRDVQEFASRVAADPPSHVVARMRGLSADTVTATPAGVLIEIVHHCSVFIIRCNHKGKFMLCCSIVTAEMRLPKLRCTTTTSCAGHSGTYAVRVVAVAPSYPAVYC